MVLSVAAFACSAADHDIAKPQADANAEDANAAYELGKLYQKGVGVPQDAGQAANWYTKSAEKGKAKAQLALSKLYYTGQGVEKNYVQAFVWSNLASIHGSIEAKGFRGKVKKFMTPAQIKQGKEMTNSWLTQHGESTLTSKGGKKPQANNKGDPKIDAAKQYCITMMTDYAKKNGADPTQYITQNIAFMQQCIQRQAAK